MSQLQQAGERCREKVESVAPFPTNFDPNDHTKPYDPERAEAWRIAERARGVEVTVIEENGYVKNMTDIGDLSGLSPLGNIKGIKISIGGGGYASPSASINLSRERGLDIQLAGPDRTWTAGLRSELEQIVSPEGKLRPVPVETWWYGLFALVLFYALMIGVGIYLRDQTDWAAALRVAIMIAVPLLLVAPLLLLAWKLPNLELLAPGAKPSWERWRKGAFGLAITLLVGVGASLAASAISRS